MTDRHILFSAPMVRALLDGRKTQTRRVLKLPKQKTLRGEWEATTAGGPGVTLRDGTPYPERAAIWHTQTGYCMTPGYAPGDRLWVREGFSGPYGCRNLPPRDWPNAGPIWHWADGNPEHGDWTRPKPSIHMPRWASRLTLTVTDVRVQRLGEISEADAVTESCNGFVSSDGNDGTSPREEFRDLWDSLNADLAPWASNPWVVALTFTVQRGNIDQKG